MSAINSIPVLGLGTWKLTGKTCITAVKKALELGYRHIDTAEYYRNHVEIGKAITGFEREDIFITSKVWASDLRYNDVLKMCDKALKELKTDYLDLYLIHWPNPKIPIEETLKAFKKLYDEGKIKNFGISNFDIGELKEVLEKTEIPITNNQIEFHPYWYRRELLEFCKENNISVTSYSSLGRGILFEESIIKKLAKKYSKTEAQILLRWALQKSTIVIPKASSESHLRENTDIFNWKISGEDIEQIDSLNRNQSVL